MQFPPTPGAEADGELPSPGRRWGVGSGSILPHLKHSIRAKPAHSADVAEAGAQPRHPACAEHPDRPSSR